MRDIESIDHLRAKDGGREASIKLDRTSSDRGEWFYEVVKWNGDLSMGKESFDDDKDGAESARFAAEAFINGKPTNIETLVHVMYWAKSGPLMQMFIMDALVKQAGAAAELKDDAWDGGMVAPAAWRETAKELKAVLDKHLKGA